jgi:hypothetical protein
MSESKCFQRKNVRTRVRTTSGSKRKIDFSGVIKGPRNPSQNGVLHGHPGGDVTGYFPRNCSPKIRK